MGWEGYLLMYENFRRSSAVVLHCQGQTTMTYRKFKLVGLSRLFHPTHTCVTRVGFADTYLLNNKNRFYGNKRQAEKFLETIHTYGGRFVTKALLFSFTRCGVFCHYFHFGWTRTERSVLWRVERVDCGWLALEINNHPKHDVYASEL